MGKIRKMKKILPLLFGIIILIVTIFYVGIEKIANIFSNADIFYFFIAAIFYLIIEITAALKLKLISKLKFKRIFLSNLGGMFLSQITPGRIGYAYTAYSISKKEKKSISGMLGIISLIQGLMLFVKIFLIAIAIIFFSLKSEIPGFLLLSFITPVFLLFAILFVLYTNSFKHFLLKIPSICKLVEYVDLMQNSVKNINYKKAFFIIVLDLFIWCFYGFQFYFLAASIGIPLDFLTCLMLHPLISAIMYIPISPSALGITETGNEIIFGLLGLGIGTGVSFVLIFRLNSLFVDSFGLVDFKNIRINEIFKQIKTKKI